MIDTTKSTGLSVQQVTVRYGDTTAVDNVTVTVPPGQVLALLGPSGCGKSSLLRAVAGLEPVGAGVIRWEGTDLAAIPVHRRNFGLMFQDGVLFPHRTVAGNVGFGLRMQGESRPATAQRVEELLDLVGLPGYGDRRVDTLSGGEQQRVALARALAPRPRLLLLDEPLAALDARLRDRLLVDLREILHRTGTTAVFVTHDQAEAFAVADQVAVMHGGRIRQHGPIAQVWAQPVDEWVARFVGYTSVVPNPDGPGLLALRTAALTVDPAGKLRAVVRSVSRRPENSLVETDVDGWGRVTAMAEPGRELAPGDRVNLTLDLRRTAVLDQTGS